MGPSAREDSSVSVAQRRLIELVEYIPLRVPREQLPDEIGELLYRQYNKQISVEFPSPKTGHDWELTALGWVGYIPISVEITIALRPKVKLSNLFRMLEYAYRLQSIQFLDGLVDCGSLEEFYEYLANVLAKRILDRSRKGFYRAYQPEDEILPYLRGRMDVNYLMKRPWDPNIRCAYEEHTADLEENQILAWTLFRIASSGALTERVLPTVRRGYHALRGLVTLTSFRPAACLNRLYNRLNEDYRPLHALSRLFLEHSGPSHESGDRTMIPFLLDMEHLFELFVAEWLQAHLPENLRVNVQQRVNIGEGGSLYFDMDLVIDNPTTGEVTFVLDTKYKAPDSPSSADVAQITAYATIKRSRNAILIYPISLREVVDARIGDIRVRSLAFRLDGDLEEAGQAFLQNVGGVVAHYPSETSRMKNPD
jgi:5-methylcytosine-specific restriction enzyme subunit McrC